MKLNYLTPDLHARQTASIKIETLAFDKVTDNIWELNERGKLHQYIWSRFDNPLWSQITIWNLNVKWN